MSNEFRADLEWVETATRNVAVVHVGGSLTAGTMDEFSRVLATATGRGAQCFVLDLERTDYVSSSGLRALLKLRRTALDAGGWVRLAAVRRVIREQVLDALGISRLFDICANVSEALGGGQQAGHVNGPPGTAAGAGGPSKTAAVASDSAAPGPRGELPVTGTIVVVDDDPMIRKILERILGAAGYTVITAADGETGRTLARDKRPSLILLDINLPGLDGGEMAQELADELRTADIPVIFISGLVTGQDEAEPGPGGYPLIAKPFERARLLERVGRYIRAFQTQV